MRRWEWGRVHHGPSTDVYYRAEPREGPAQSLWIACRGRPARGRREDAGRPGRAAGGGNVFGRPPRPVACDRPTGRDAASRRRPATCVDDGPFYRRWLAEFDGSDGRGPTRGGDGDRRAARHPEPAQALVQLDDPVPAEVAAGLERIGRIRRREQICRIEGRFPNTLVERPAWRARTRPGHPDFMEETDARLESQAARRDQIGSDIRIKVVKVDRNQVRLGIEAPPDVVIVRDELVDDPEAPRGPIGLGVVRAEGLRPTGRTPGRRRGLPRRPAMAPRRAGPVPGPTPDRVEPAVRPPAGPGPVGQKRGRSERRRRPPRPRPRWPPLY